ncbi:hypothetical protein ABPG75_000470 [Micractinium tetrahymenae]
MHLGLLLLLLLLCALAAGGKLHSDAEHVNEHAGLRVAAAQPSRRLLAEPYTFAGKFGSRGGDPSQFTQLLQGLTVASPADGRAVYVVDCAPSDDGSSPCSVKVFSRQGDYLRTIGGPGTGPGQFLFASGIAVLDGLLYVSDIATELPRVSVFNASTGDFLFTFGGPGADAGRMAEPYALAAANGVIYVVDRNLNRVSMFGGDGSYIKHWGNPDPSAVEDPNAPPTTAPGLFDAPCGIAEGELGDVYVLDCGNFRVQQFTATGDFVRQWGSEGPGPGQFSKPRGIAAVGTWVFTVEGPPRIQQFDGGSGSLQLAWGVRSEPLPAPPADGTLKSPFAIAADEAGAVWVQDNGNSRVQKFVTSTPVPHGYLPPPPASLPLSPPPLRSLSPTPIRRPPPKPQASGHRRPPPSPIRRPPPARSPPPPPLFRRPPPSRKLFLLPQCKALNQQCTAATKCCGQFKCRAVKPRICVR